MNEGNKSVVNSLIIYRLVLTIKFYTQLTIELIFMV